MKKNLYLFIALGVLVVFTLVYFISANKISYAFSYNEEETLYESKMSSLKTIAIAYAEKNPDLFKDKSDIYVTVDELVENNYLIADDDEGNVFDPTSDTKTLNDMKIRITKTEDGTYKTKILK